MSRGRLFHNIWAANVKARSRRVFDDFIGGKRSKIPSQELRRLQREGVATQIKEER